MTATRRGRTAANPARRLIRFGARPGIMSLRGVGRYRSLPLLLVEERERALLRLDYAAALGPGDQLTGFELSRRGCSAAAVFAECAAEVAVWGVRPRYFDGYGCDYGWDYEDSLEVRAHLSTGEIMLQRLYVRAPNRLRDWETRGMSDTADVIDQRALPVYDPAAERHVAGAMAVPLGYAPGTWADGQVYRVTDFGEDFGEDFGT